jgi:hypothetical protein
MEDLVGVREANAREDAAKDSRLSRNEKNAILARPHGAQAFGLLNDIEPVMSADVDLNRRVTPEEFHAAAERRFAKLDLNGDGYFVASETPAPIWQFQERRDDGE